jgi:hypothetical protein
MSAADERAKAIKVAHVDFDKALILAEKVSDAWYRCQSLAAVARFAPEGEVIRVANKALKAASLGADTYKRVAVAAWPVRALAERGKFEHAQRGVVSLLVEANQIEPPVSKISALELLWQAVWTFPVAVNQLVLDTLLSACQVTNSWKAGRIVRDVALVVAAQDRTQAQRIIHSMRESIYKRRAQKQLDAGKMETIRSFF